MKTDIGGAWLTLGKSILSALTDQDFGSSEIGYIDMDMDYDLQSRNFMRYSDLYNDDGDYDDRIGHFLRGDDRYDEFENKIRYSTCSYAYLEDAISSETELRDDEVHSNIMPFMFNAYPLLTFMPKASGAKIPEFYEDVPLVVSDDVYDSVDEEYETIFKVWTGDGNEIEITSSDNAHALSMDVKEIDVYLISYKDLNTESHDNVITRYNQKDLFSLSSSDFSFISGKIILNSGIYQDIKEDYLARRDAVDLNQERVFVIFEIKLGKHESVASSGDNAKIAIMQGVQAALLEYFYQSNLAVESQAKLNELAYTVVITLLTTIFSGGLLTNPKMLISEPLEEMFLDPSIEALVSNTVEAIGWGAYAQIAACSIAEGGREAATGDLATAIRGSKTNTQLNLDKQVNQAETQQTKARRGIIMSSLLIFGMAFTGIGIPTGIGLGLGTLGITSMLGTYSKVRSSYKKVVEVKKTHTDIQQQYELFVNPAIKELQKSNPELAMLTEELYKASIFKQFGLALDQKPKLTNGMFDSLLAKDPTIGIKSLDSMLKAIRLGQYQLDKTSAKGIVAKSVAEVIKGESRTLGQIAHEAGIDIITARTYIAELLFALFRSNPDIAQSYYAQIISANEFEEGSTKPSWLKQNDANTYTFSSAIGPEGRGIRISVPKDVSVGFIKYLVGQKFGLDPSDFHLSFNGITMDESKKLEDYTHDDTIDVENTEILIIPASTAGAPDQDANEDIDDSIRIEKLFRLGEFTSLASIAKEKSRDLIGQYNREQFKVDKKGRIYKVTMFKEKPRLSRFEPYAIKDFIGLYFKAFTEDENSILENLDDNIKKKLSIKIGENNILSFKKGNYDTEKLLNQKDLYTILGIRRDAVNNPTTIANKRFITYYKLNMAPQILKARTNSLKNIKYYDWCRIAFDKFLNDIGIDVKYTYLIFETFNKYSDKGDNIGFKRKIKDFIPIGDLASLLGMAKGDSFKVTSIKVEAVINRLVNILLLRHTDVSSLGISRNNLVNLKKDCYQITLEMLIKSGKILYGEETRTFDALKVQPVMMERNIDKFNMYISTLLAINYDKGGGKIRPMKKMFSLSDLSELVSGSTIKDNKRIYLSTSLKQDSITRQKVCKELLSIVDSHNGRKNHFGRSAQLHIMDYLLKYRPYAFGDYNEHFDDLLEIQQKEHLDVSLGLDVLQLQFTKDGVRIGVQRHHLDRDRPYYCMLKTYPDGSLKVKLVPLSYTSHMNDLHFRYKKHNDYATWRKNNDLAQARFQHLFELSKLQYNPKINNYQQFLVQEFRNKKAIVHGKEVNIWDKNKGSYFFASDNILGDWIKRWEAKKTHSEEEWYTAPLIDNKPLYKEFYTKTYKPYTDELYKFIKGEYKGKRSDFWRWYIQVYLYENAEYYDESSFF